MNEGSDEKKYLEELKSIDVALESTRLINSVSFIPPKFIAIGSDSYASNPKTGLILDISTSKVISELKGLHEKSSFIKSLPNGGLFVVGDGKAKICNPASGEAVGKFALKDIGTPNMIKVFPNGYVLLADGNHNKISLVNSMNGEVIGLYKKDKYVKCIAIDTTNLRFVTGHADGEVFLWDVQSGLSKRLFGKHESDVTQCLIFPERNVVVSCSGRSNRKMQIFIFDINTRQKIGEIDCTECVKSDFTASEVINSTFFVTAHSDGTICVWDVEEPELVQMYQKAHRGKIFDLDFCVKTKQLISTNYMNLKVWEVHSSLFMQVEQVITTTTTTVPVTTQSPVCGNCSQLQVQILKLQGEVNALTEENRILKKQIGVVSDKITPENLVQPQQQMQGFVQGRAPPQPLPQQQQFGNQYNNNMMQQKQTVQPMNQNMNMGNQGGNQMMGNQRSGNMMQIGNQGIMPMNQGRGNMNMNMGNQNMNMNIGRQNMNQMGGMQQNMGGMQQNNQMTENQMMGNQMMGRGMQPNINMMGNQQQMNMMGRGVMGNQNNMMGNQMGGMQQQQLGGYRRY